MPEGLQPLEVGQNGHSEKAGVHLPAKQWLKAFRIVGGIEYLY